MVVMFAEGFFQTIFHVYIHIFIYTYDMQVVKNLLNKFNLPRSNG